MKYIVLGVVALLLSCTSKQADQTELSLPYYSQMDFTPVWMELEDPGIKEIHTIPAFRFTNQEGKIVSDETMKGKIYVTNFFFTICPSVCPKMTKNLDRVQEAFKNDPEVLLLSHTVMPWVDSVSVLKTYAEENGIITDKWHLVTGSKELIYNMGRQAYFVDEGFGKSVTSNSEFLHTENIILVDQNRHIRGVYNGTLPLEMARIIEDIGKLKKESKLN